jgi:hypothetical protein
LCRLDLVALAADRLKVFVVVAAPLFSGALVVDLSCRLDDPGLRADLTQATIAVQDLFSAAPPG